MRKEYKKPVMMGEKFVADEFVSVCWGVACNTSAANQIEKNMNNNPIGGHRSTQCGNKNHQYILVDGQGNAVDIEERGHDLWGTLDGTITNQNYEPLSAEAIGAIEPGDTIYWVTSQSGNTYHHVGTVSAWDENYPNRS